MRTKLLLFFIITLLVQSHVYAVYDPLSVANNKYGIHVTDTNDINDTAQLVNSAGGEWGYVTIVIPENDRNSSKWQEIFNSMRRFHLIPIVRIATHVENGSWTIPQKVDADKWADFLNQLNWPIENRYIVLFNEPNHAKEWGNTLDPEGYTDTALTYAQALKKASEDFFILPAGLDVSASSDGQALDASEYLRRMYTAKPEFFTVIDGWTSHSYPNPAFSGSPYSSGRGTVRSLEWEQQLLQQLGVTKKLPVFITETGWMHNQGKNIDNSKASPDQVGQYFNILVSGIWSDPTIVAITPFVFNYQDVPFDHFSMKKIGSSEFYQHYYDYQKISKTKGEPQQHESVQIIEPLLPASLVMNSSYTLKTKIKNTGQSIISSREGYELELTAEKNKLEFIAEPVPYLDPNEQGEITIHLKTPKEEGAIKTAVSIRHNIKLVPVETKTVTIIPPPTISVSTAFGWKKSMSFNNAAILIYDINDELLHKFTGVTIKNNEASITGLYNMIPGKKYRLVLLVPYYLPGQALIMIKEGKTNVALKRFLPLDFNGDGALTYLDFIALLKSKPHDVFERIF